MTTVSKVGYAVILCTTLVIAPQHVSRVLDGDTFGLYHVGIPPEERVRVLGVNTPERGTTRAEVAASYTKAWLAQGPFELTYCKRDGFGRILGEVWRKGERLADKLIQDTPGTVPYREGAK